MIIGIGSDLIDIRRIENSLSRFGERFVQRCFTEIEIAKSEGRKNRAASYAKRFAAKEAFQKVWPRPHGWRDVWVERERTPDGPFPYAAPMLGFAPPIAGEMQERGWVAHLTLTHTREHASAVVVLEKRL